MTEAITSADAEETGDDAMELTVWDALCLSRIPATGSRTQSVPVPSLTVPTWTEAA